MSLPFTARLIPVMLASSALLASSCGGKDSGGASHEELVLGCLRSTACGVRPYPRIANCVDAYYNLHVTLGVGPVYDAIYRCANAARGDCEKIFACYGANRAAGRCDTTFAARCDGDTAVSCDTLAGRVLSYDCSAAKLGCMVKAGGSFEATCTTGACSGGAICDAGRALGCRDGMAEVEDCPAQGLACSEGRCVGESSESCAQPFSASCEGNTAVTCVNGRVHRADCGSRPVDRRCEAGTCTRSGVECSDDFDRCQGPALQTCIDGGWQTYDCASLGLGPCQAATNGAACTALN
jgi:hypothetical protein